MATNTRDDTDESNANRDGAQITLPDIDTSFLNRDLAGDFTGREIVMMGPGILMMALGVFVGMLVSPAIGFGFGAVGLVGMFAGYYFALTARRISPIQKFLTAIRFHRLTNRLPWGPTETARESIHELDTIYHDGVAEMEDGRLCIPIKLQGRNVYGETQADKNKLVSQLSSAIDKDLDCSFRWYSTSRRESADRLANPYEQRGLSFRGTDAGGTGYLRALLFDVATWMREADVPDWDASRWDHYLVVQVTPEDGDVSDHRTERETPLETIVRIINPLAGDQTVSGINKRREMRRTLTDRIDTVLGNVAGAVEGLEAERPSPDEHACLLLSYWTDEHHTPDEELQLAHKRTGDGPSVWPRARSFDTQTADESATPDDPVGNQLANDRLTNNTPPTAAADGGVDPPSHDTDETESGTTTAFDASHIDVGEGYIQIGEQYCKTFWIEEFPAFPESVCFEELFTTPGVDVDVCIHVDPEHKRSVREELDNDQNFLSGEGDMKAVEGDHSASDIRSDQDLYDEFATELEGATESWKINGYVTVRVGPQKVVDDLNDLPDDEYDFESLDAAMMQSLINESRKVRRILTSGPEHLLPKVPQKSQLEAFRSCGPTSRDVYNDESRDELATRALGGAVGAMFPPCSATIFEDDGIDWGRNQHNGTHVRADPFQRGSSPHMITIGKSRSGKTYGATKAAQRWYADQSNGATDTSAPSDSSDTEPHDRTLIVCDTESGFDGLTKACDGEHIVIDGSATINPLDIHPVPEHLLEASGGKEDPYRMQVDAVVQFFVGILDSQGVPNPESFTSTIEEALEHTYAEYEIYPGQPTSLHNESPTVEDFIETLREIGDNPEKFSFGGAEWETAPKVEQAARLLDKLSGFRDDEKRTGKYSHFVGHSDIDIMNDDVDMVYLDLKQFQNSADAEKAAMLQLMLTLVANKIRTTEGEKIFMADEAHFLLHSESMSQWLSSAAREWARYDAALWFISQHPEEFVTTDQADDADSKKDEILGQVSMMQVYYASNVKPEVWRAFGLNDHHISLIDESLTRGKSGQGYSECLISFDDRKGWLPIYVEASPLEHLLLTYTPREDDDFDTYLARNSHELPPGTVSELPNNIRRTINQLYNNY